MRILDAVRRPRSIYWYTERSPRGRRCSFRVGAWYKTAAGKADAKRRGDAFTAPGGPLDQIFTTAAAARLAVVFPSPPADA